MGQNQEPRREERGSDFLSSEREEVMETEVERRGEIHSDQGPHFSNDYTGKEDSLRSDVQALVRYDNKQHRESNHAVALRSGRAKEAVRSNLNIKEAPAQPSQPFNEDGWRRQCVELQARLQRAEEEKKNIANQAQIDTDRLSSQIRSLKEENRSRKDTLRREADRLAQTKLRLENEIKNLAEDLDRERRVRSDMERQLERKLETIVILKDELKKSEAQYSEINNLLKATAKELRSAEVFLNNAEWFSRDELVNMVGSLSSQILDAASFMAELRFDRPSGDLTVGNVWLEDMIGKLMLSLLVAKPPQEDMLPLQLALQHCMILQCKRSLTSFCSSGEHNSFLADLLNKIRSSEEQSVTGRWRAMTFANCKRLKSPSMTDMTDDIICILTTCGWRREDEKSFSDCVKKIQKYLSSIEEAVAKLKAATMEGITSADVLPYVVAPDTPFEPSQMINAYPSKGSRTDSKGEHVLCTTDIGLQSFVTKRSRQEILLRPKVVLASAFQAK